MDFESAMQTFAEAWVAANASLKGQQLQQQQQQQQQQHESREPSSEVGSSQPLRTSSHLMEADPVRSNYDAAQSYKRNIKRFHYIIIFSRVTPSKGKKQKIR
jgi:hypothetical protein